MHDNLNEKCAVVGIFGHQEASKLAYFSLHSLQHRGQEAAGISSADGKKLHTIKKRGLVMRVFDEDKLRTLSGSAAIGHTRYSTAGDDINKGQFSYFDKGAGYERKLREY